MYVRPPGVIGNLKAIAPRFNWAGTPHQHLSTHNPVLQARQRNLFQRPKTCQRCGHLLSTERYAVNHNIGGFRGGKWVCMVPTDDRREPDHKRWPNNRFNGLCTCTDCRAYMEGVGGLIDMCRKNNRFR